MPDRARSLLPLVALLGGMAACGGSSSGPAPKQFKASELFADPKVAALAEALRSNDLTKAGQLLGEGVDINAIGKDGITLATWTMMAKNKPSFKWLFEHGANPNLIPPNDRGVLQWAAGADDPDWLETLILHKANVNLQWKSEIEDTETPLLEAISERRKTNLEILIKAGADVNFRGPEEMDAGGTPAIDAAVIGWFEGVYILLEAGADFRPRSTGGLDLTYEVVRHSAALNNESAQWREKVIQLLKERGADIEAAQKRVEAEKAQDRKERPWAYTR